MVLSWCREVRQIDQSNEPTTVASRKQKHGGSVRVFVKQKNYLGDRGGQKWNIWSSICGLQFAEQEVVAVRKEREESRKIVAAHMKKK